MARIPLFRRRPPGQPPEAPASEGEAPPPEQTPPAEAAAPQARRAPYNPGLLRRERRALVRAREERIRDLGGLILEMFRRDRFREDLIREQAGEVFGMEARIQEIDKLVTTARKQMPPTRRAPRGASGGGESSASGARGGNTLVNRCSPRPSRRSSSSARPTG